MVVGAKGEAGGVVVESALVSLVYGACGSGAAIFCAVAPSLPHMIVGSGVMFVVVVGVVGAEVLPGCGQWLELIPAVVWVEVVVVVVVVWVVVVVVVAVVWVEVVVVGVVVWVEVVVVVVVLV